MNVTALINQLTKYGTKLCLVVCLLGTQLVLADHVTKHALTKSGDLCEQCTLALQTSHTVTSNVFHASIPFEPESTASVRLNLQYTPVLLEAYRSRAPPLSL